MRLSTVLVAAPLTVLGVVFAIANRQPVRLSLNPFDPADGALGIEMPLFAALFLAVLVGMAIAGLAVWFAQARWRRRARAEHREAVRLRRLASKTQADEPRPAATP
ncbi:MAG: lipopolysaccharide assembly protein LapA domain-containing protein [Alphaproteobacteria bacterium]